MFSRVVLGDPRRKGRLYDVRISSEWTYNEFLRDPQNANKHRPNQRKYYGGPKIKFKLETRATFQFVRQVNNIIDA